MTSNPKKPKPALNWAPLPYKYRKTTRHNPAKRAILATLFWTAVTKPCQVPYKKSFLALERGQMKTTYEAIAEDVGVDYRVVKRVCEEFALEGILKIESIYRGQVITLLHYHQKKVKKTKTAGYDMVGEMVGESVADNVSGTKGSMNGGLSDGRSDGRRLGSLIKNYKNLEEEIKNPSNEGVNAHARADEEPPPFEDNLISFPSGEDRGEDYSDVPWEDQPDIPDRSNSNKKAQPEPRNPIAIRWHRDASEIDSKGNYPIERYKAAIDEIFSKTKYSDDDMARILDFLQTGLDKLMTENFIYPWQWSQKWGSHPNLLEACFFFMKTKQKRIRTIEEKMMERY